MLETLAFMDRDRPLLQAERLPICSAGGPEMDASTSPLLQERSTSTCDALAGDVCTDDGALTGSSDPETSSPFCIRGYVAAVREIDIKRCWPFSLCLLEKSIQAGKDPLLPPLTPFGCVVRVQREYFEGADHGATCEVSSEPQLQVQIDVSKCENESPIADTAGQLPVEREHTLPSPDVACGPLTVLPQRHCSPYVERGLALKKQMPRSIEEIRKSIMQGCECTRCMGTEVCEKQSCSDPDSKYFSHKEGTDVCTEENSTERLNDAIDSWQKEKVTTCENVSAIMDLEESMKFPDTRRDAIKNAISGVDDGPNLSNRSHDDAREAGDHLPRSCNLSHESEKNVWSKELPPLTNMEPRPSTDCGLDSKGLTKSIESHTIKSLELHPNDSDAVSMQQEELEIVSGPDVIPQQRCPVCADFQCTSNTALNAHMDGCLAMTSGELVDKLKMKSQRGKVRKKRSMAELCQVALPTGRTMELPSPGSTNTPHNGKEIIGTDSLERKRSKIHPRVVENTTTVPSKSDGSRKQAKSRNQALKVFRWRSKSASTSLDTQSFQGSKRGMAPEASLAHFNKSRLRSRKLEMKGSRALRKNQWKRGKIIREPSPFDKSSRHGTQQSQKHIPTERRKGKRVPQNNVNCLQRALLKASAAMESNEFENSAPDVEGQEVSNLALPRKRKHPDPTSHMRTSETVVTVKGSHETTFEFLRADEAVVEELNEPRKVHFLVHVKPRKKRSKQKTIVRMPQSRHHTETVLIDANENPKFVCSHIKTNHIERPLPGDGQSSLVKNKIKSFDNSRSAQKILTPEMQLPPLSHARLSLQAQEGLPPVQVTSSLHQRLLEDGDHPSMATAGRSTIKDTSKSFTESDGRPLFSHNLHTKDLQNHSDGCTGQSLASLLNESPPGQCTNSQKAQPSSTLASMLPQCRGAKVQRRRQFPFSLSADELSQWPQNKTSSRAAYQFRPEQIAKLAQILGVSNRNRGFLAGKQTLRPGAKLSFQQKISQMTPQLDQAPQVNTKQLSNMGGSELNTCQAHSDHQRLPAWMQAAIHEQRPSAMPSMEMLTSPVGHITLNTTSSIGRDMSNPSSTLNVIRNPVLRLMGKTMVLLPDVSQDQVDLNSSHPPSSSKYINFLQTLESEEQGQHWNEDRVYNSAAQEDIASQDFGCSNGVESWVDSSRPRLQDFFLQMSSSSPKRKSPMPDQTTSHWAKGRTVPEQEDNSRWLQLESSPLSLRLLHTENTNWQSQKGSTQPLFQPQSSNLRCDCAERVTRHPLCESADMWPRQHKYLASYETREATNDLLCLGPSRTRTSDAPSLPCWLSNDDRADQRGDQRGTLTVVDEEGPLCSFDRSTPGPSKDLMLSSGQKNQRPQPNTKRQSKAQNSGASKSRKDKQKSKTFIPIIYTVGGNAGGSHHTPEIAGDRPHQTAAEETGFRDTAQVSGALTNLRRKISCLDQPAMQTRISTHEDGGDPPNHVNKVGAKSHNISEACQFGCDSCDLAPMPSMEAIRAAARRMRSMPIKTRNSLCRTLLSSKLSVPVPQEIATAKAPAPLELETPRLEMCSVNMNPAEVDCQDAGQFMSTPKFISSFRGSTTSDAGQKCIHTNQAMKAPLHPQNVNSVQTNLQDNTIHNAALPAPSSPKQTPETNIRRLMLDSPCAKASQKDVHNSLTSPSSSKTPAALEKVSTKGTVSMPFNAANFLAMNCSNDTGMHQECNSRLHALKAAGKFRISNGRVLMVRKEVPVDMSSGKCLQGQ